MPEWVHVWFWLRYFRRPVLQTPLPHQDDRDPRAISWEQYETFRQEWLAAGAPKTTSKALLAAMGADALAEPVPF